MILGLLKGKYYKMKFKKLYLNKYLLFILNLNFKLFYFIKKKILLKIYEKK